MILQLDPPLPLMTPKGPGICHLLIDHGPEHHLVWVVIDDVTGQIWSWENPNVRGTKNITWGRPNPERPEIRRAT